MPTDKRWQFYGYDKITSLWNKPAPAFNKLATWANYPNAFSTWQTIFWLIPTLMNIVCWHVCNQLVLRTYPLREKCTQLDEVIYVDGEAPGLYPGGLDHLRSGIRGRAIVGEGGVTRKLAPSKKCSKSLPWSHKGRRYLSLSQPQRIIPEPLQGQMVCQMITHTKSVIQLWHMWPIFSYSCLHCQWYVRLHLW